MTKVTATEKLKPTRLKALHNLTPQTQLEALWVIVSELDKRGRITLPEETRAILDIMGTEVANNPHKGLVKAGDKEESRRVPLHLVNEE